MAGPVRAIVMAVAFGGDWLLVVVTLAELTVSAVAAFEAAFGASRSWNAIDAAAWLGDARPGSQFPGSSRHGIWKQNASGGSRRRRDRGDSRQPSGNDRHWLDAWNWTWTPRRMRVVLVVAWLVPLAALLAAAVPLDHRGVAHIPWSGV